jgi:hypothetical protein
MEVALHVLALQCGLDPAVDEAVRPERRSEHRPVGWWS